MSPAAVQWLALATVVGITVGWYLRSLWGRRSHAWLAPGQRFLPCPFCGGHWIATDIEEEFAGCNDCGADTPVEVWNCRVGMAPIAAPIISRSIPAGERGHGDLGFLGVVIALVVIAGPLVAALHPQKGDSDAPYVIGEQDGVTVLSRGRRVTPVPTIDHIDERWPGPVCRALALLLVVHEPRPKRRPRPRTRADMAAWERAVLTSLGPRRC